MEDHPNVTFENQLLNSLEVSQSGCLLIGLGSPDLLLAAIGFAALPFAAAPAVVRALIGVAAAEEEAVYLWVATIGVEAAAPVLTPFLGLNSSLLLTPECCIIVDIFTVEELAAYEGVAAGLAGVANLEGVVGRNDLLFN
jgi:hypothetical protein